jgi:hypothetical protein
MMTKKINKYLVSEAQFEPGKHQSIVKARFYRRLAEMEHVADRETIMENNKLLVQLCGTERILRWLVDVPGFAPWFLDTDTLADKIHGEQTAAVNVLAQILGDPAASDGDKIKSARTLLELGDTFPNKKSEVRFLDDRLNSMNESDVNQEMLKLDAELKQLDEPK